MTPQIGRRNDINDAIKLNNKMALTFANSCNNTVSLVTRLTYTVVFACRLRLALRTAYVYGIPGKFSAFVITHRVNKTKKEHLDIRHKVQNQVITH